MNTEELRQEYLEAVRLHLYYKGSRFSHNPHKASKEAADYYLKVAHDSFEKWVKSKHDVQA